MLNAAGYDGINNCKNDANSIVLTTTDENLQSKQLENLLLTGKLL